MLVEVHDRDELRGALEIGARDRSAINNRDLRDFSVDVERTEALMDDDPGRRDGRLGVGDRAAPSSCGDSRERGVHAVLVGESLMRAADPAAALRALSARNPDAHLAAP